MHIVYAFEKPPQGYSQALFLAGPTPRDADTPSWRPEAIKVLEELGYDGVVFVPEDRNGEWKHNYDQQVEWEEDGLNRADAIVFWVPRQLPSMPAFTTNVEYGRWYESGKCVLGYPEDARKMSYLAYYAKKHLMPIRHTLRETIEAALAKIGGGALRNGGETEVPVDIWNSPSFKSWYERVIKGPGNRLDGFRVKLVCRAGPEKKFIFLWVAHVNVWVAAENRHKSNEVIVARPNISSVVMYRRGLTLLDAKVVLVREFRSTASNARGQVLELPGGSSWKPGKDPKTVMGDECFEETGIRLDPERIRILGDRQLAATFATHRALVGAVELTEEEMAEAEARVGSVRAEPHETGERVYLAVERLWRLVREEQMDWSNLGMIFSAVGEE